MKKLSFELTDDGHHTNVKYRCEGFNDLEVIGVLSLKISEIQQHLRDLMQKTAVDNSDEDG